MEIIEKFGFAENTIGFDISICVQDVRFPFENDIPGGRSRLPNTEIRKKYNWVGLQYL